MLNSRQFAGIKTGDIPKLDKQNRPILFEKMLLNFPLYIGTQT